MSKLIGKISLSLSRLVNAAPVPPGPPYKWVQDTQIAPQPQSNVPGTVQFTPFVHVPVAAARFLKELSDIGFDLNKKFDIQMVLSLLPETIFEDLPVGEDSNNPSGNWKDVFISWWKNLSTEDLTQLNTSLQQHKIESPQKDIIQMPVRRGPEAYPLDPSLYQKDWIPERDDPGYGKSDVSKAPGWADIEFNKKSFIRISLKKIASQFEEWLKSSWPKMSQTMFIHMLPFDTVADIYRILARHSPDQARNIQQLLAGGEEGYKRYIGPLYESLSGDVQQQVEPQKSETFEEKVLRQEQESLQNVQLQDQATQRHREYLDRKKEKLDQNKRTQKLDELVFKYHYIMLSKYMGNLGSYTGMRVGSYNISNLPDKILLYLLGTGMNVNPDMQFSNHNDMYILESKDKAEATISECFAAIDHVNKILEKREPAERETLAFIKNRADIMDSISKDFAEGKYPFMYEIRNQFLNGYPPINPDDMTNIVNNNSDLASDAEKMYAKSSKNFPCDLIDPETKSIYELSQIKKLATKWSNAKPMVESLGISNTEVPEQILNTDGPETPLDESVVGEATAGDFASNIPVDAKISKKLKIKMMQEGIYQYIIDTIGSVDGISLKTDQMETIRIYDTRGPSAAKPNIPAKVGLWVRNYGEDRGAEGVIVGQENGYVAVFVPGQGFNKITGWKPAECAVSAGDQIGLMD